MWHLWAPRRGVWTHCWCDIFDIFNSITARVGACDSIISARVGARVGACFRHVAHVRYPLLTSKPIYNVGKVGADVLVSREHFVRNIDEYIIEAAREMAAASGMK